MSEPMTTVFDVMEPEEPHLTDASISALRTIFGERDVEMIAAMPAYQLAQEIKVSRESSGFPADIQPIRAANALLEFIKTGDFVAETNTATAQTIKVELPKTPDQMTLSELLTQLRNDPSLYSDLAPHIEELPAVKKAAWKAPNWALRDAAGKLDVNATVGYVTHLNKRASWVRTEVGGQRPTSLARIFNQEERPMLNPFATNRDELVVIGPFFDDFDLGNLSEERHLAYLWAMKTNHPARPRPIDPYVHVAEAFAEELKGRWKKMVDAYNAAKKDNDPTTEGLLRYAPADYVSGSRLPFGGESQVKPERDEAWYREQLEAIAVSSFNRSSMNATLKKGVYRRVQLSGMNSSCQRAIVLEGGSVSGMNASGTIYVPRGVYVSISGMNADVDVIDMSYEGLFKKAVEFRLIGSDGNAVETLSPESGSRGGVTFRNVNIGGNGKTFVAGTMTFGQDDW